MGFDLYHIDTVSQYRSGIAVSDQPNGPWVLLDVPGYSACDQPTRIAPQQHDSIPPPE